MRLTSFYHLNIMTTQRLLFCNKSCFCRSEPYLDGSRMTSTKAIKQSQGKSSTTTKTDGTEDVELKTSAQQSLTEIGNQLTLQTLPRSTKKDSEAVEGDIGILTHGPSYRGPRTLLYIVNNPQESVVKVTQSADSSKQNRTELMASTDQQTL